MARASLRGLGRRLSGAAIAGVGLAFAGRRLDRPRAPRWAMLQRPGRRRDARAPDHAMCGIAGTAGGAPPDPSLLHAMAQTMAQRGPDGEGAWHDDTVGLAFRRLAVIDLHERSSQPMHLGSLHLVFNGEIYNYRELRARLRRLGHAFRTEGDAEVLLH